MNSIESESELAPKREAEDTVMEDGDQSKRIAQEAQSFLAEQTHQVIIPSYAGWFKMEDIDTIEKKSNPEFFNGRNRSKNPNVYKDYRDFMINTYRLNPMEYLTVTACRRNLAGDVCAVMRVHAFLEQWGLINYQIEAESRPSNIGPPFTGHFRVVADTPRGLQPFQPTPSISLSEGRPLLKTTELSNNLPLPNLNLELRRDVYTANGSDVANDTTGEKLKKSQCNCFTCGIDCSRMRYHCINQKNFDLCLSCYQEGRFPSSTASGDFLKMEMDNHTHNANDWTDQEVLLLLEGLEMFDDNWPSIAAHVGTRDKQQCVSKFLQLPIEDPYLQEEGLSERNPLRFAQAPYGQHENPIMSVVAFLASTVPLDVAAAVAETSIKAAGSSSDDKVVHKTSLYQDGVETSDAQAENAYISPRVDASAMKAARIALGASAAKAKVLASHEEQSFNMLLSLNVTTQLQKLELKITQLEQLEKSLNGEKRMLESSQNSFYMERLAFKKRAAGAMHSANKLVEHTEAPESHNDVPSDLNDAPLLEP